jgi:1,4-alpha-glucan branching enzyme
LQCVVRSDITARRLSRLAPWQPRRTLLRKDGYFWKGALNMMVQGKKNGPVTFICDLNPQAREVYLVGDFNDWQPRRTPMIKAKDGTFRASVRLAPGQHQYKFVVDGVWMNDPEASHQVMNPYGTLNSLVSLA